MRRPTSLWSAVALAACLLTALASAGRDDGRWHDSPDEISIRVLPVLIAGPPREAISSQPQLEEELRRWAAGLAGDAW